LKTQDVALVMSPTENDILKDELRTAICGTDVHIYEWNDWAKRTIPTPMVVGHEYCGVIKELGHDLRVQKAQESQSITE